MSKPTVFALTKQSNDFVFSNKDFLKKSLLVFFPLILVLAGVNAAAKMSHMPYADLVMAFLYLLVYGSFALSWHRTCLVADGNAHIVTPFRFGKADLVFLAFFIALCAGLSGVIAGVDWLARSYAVRHEIAPYDTAARIMFGASLVPDIAAVYLFFRLSFVLPALSVGHTMTLREVMQTSKGILWRLVGADFIFILLFLLLMTVYASVSLEVMRVAISEAPDVNDVQAAAIGILVSSPIHLMWLVTMALMTTALSKAYRWGVENNPV